MKIKSTNGCSCLVVDTFVRQCAVIVIVLLSKTALFLVIICPLGSNISTIVLSRCVMIHCQLSAMPEKDVETVGAVAADRCSVLIIDSSWVRVVDI